MVQCIFNLEFCEKENITFTIKTLITYYHILSSIMHVQIKCAPKFLNDFWQKNYFYFSRIISQELLIASLLITMAILNPFSATFHV
jgi:hypothetical protein